MNQEQLNELLNESGLPCVSIIIPTHRLSPGRTMDPEVVSQVIAKAKSLLEYNYTEKGYDITPLLQRLDQAIRNIDFTHESEGIGIFISPRMAHVVKFPFPVKEKIKVADIFDSRDLLYFHDRMMGYCVLSISKEHIHLFTGSGGILHEVKNKDFPINYSETYEYARPTIGTSFGYSAKGYEKDKSILREIRVVDFLRKTNELLGSYLNGTHGLIISGGKKEVADFLSITQFKDRVIAQLHGNYDFAGDHQLAGLAWEAVTHFRANNDKTLHLQLKELVGKDMLAQGVEEVGRAAAEGKGLHLVVEKDLECPAFFSPDHYDVKLTKPFSVPKYNYTSDAVEEIIRMILHKKGKVSFMENGSLEDLGGIALQLRYNNHPH